MQRLTVAVQPVRSRAVPLAGAEQLDPGTAVVVVGVVVVVVVPLAGTHVGPDDLRVVVTKEQVRAAPDIEMHGEEVSQDDESALTLWPAR
jgi:hypothetical protein